MSIKLAVRPKVIVNSDVTPLRSLIDWGVAMTWLGKRYLCFKPLNRKSARA